MPTAQLLAKVKVLPRNHAFIEFHPERVAQCHRLGRESLPPQAWAHHDVGDERLKLDVAAGAALEADARQLRLLAVRAARQVNAQPVQEGERVVGRLGPQVVPD